MLFKLKQPLINSQNLKKEHPSILSSSSTSNILLLLLLLAEYLPVINAQTTDSKSSTEQNFIVSSDVENYLSGVAIIGLAMLAIALTYFTRHTSPKVRILSPSDDNNKSDLAQEMTQKKLTSIHKNLPSQIHKPVQIMKTKIFNNLTTLTSFLNNCESFSLVQNIPENVRAQKGQTCKLYALSHAMETYRHLFPDLPVARKRDNSEIKTPSLRKQAKKFYGSKVGEMYNYTEMLDLAKKNNMVNSEIYKPRNEQEYIEIIKYITGIKNQPAVICFDVSLSTTTRGESRELKGTQEHSGAILGYCNYSNALYFIISQWGNYYLHKAEDIARSAMQIEKRSSEEYYKIRLPGQKPNWVEMNSFLGLQDRTFTDNHIVHQIKKGLFSLSFFMVKSHHTSSPTTDDYPLGRCIISIAP